MTNLIDDLIPHAPQVGLYVRPNIPDDKLRNALGDYGKQVAREDVVALYDATLMGSAKDGALFTADRVVFQNNDLEPVQLVRYADVVNVEEKRKLMGGRRVHLSVNRGRATFDVAMDFSAHGDAAHYVARFLKEAMLRGAAEEMDGEDARTDEAAVRRSLEGLCDQGLLTRIDLERMMAALRQP